jgi:hypothetical protein
VSRARLAQALGEYLSLVISHQLTKFHDLPRHFVKPGRMAKRSVLLASSYAIAGIPTRAEGIGFGIQTDRTS